MSLSCTVRETQQDIDFNRSHLYLAPAKLPHQSFVKIWHQKYWLLYGVVCIILGLAILTQPLVMDGQRRMDRDGHAP